MPAGVRTRAATHQLDSIVFATGYDAVTGSLDRIDIRGRGGAALKAKWAHGPRTCLGLMSAGFPNLFLITGPQSPSVLTNVVVAIEQHVDWIAGCLGHMQSRGLRVVEPTVGAEDDWVAHADQVASKTLHASTNSWYTGANIPGKPRTFLPYIGGLNNYSVICDEVAAAGYRGFAFARAPAPTPFPSTLVPQDSTTTET